MTSEPFNTTRWWWVRHAQVMGYGDGCITGQGDLDCDVSDHTQLSALAAHLPKNATWLTSPLKRTAQTAKALLDARPDLAPLEMQEHGVLMEQDFGDWTGKTWDQVGELSGDQASRFWDAPATSRPPGGESFEDVMVRVRGFIEAELASAGPGTGQRDIVVVGHAGTIRSQLALALGLGAERALSFEITNLSLSRFEHTAAEDWQVASVNWTA